MSFSSSIIQKIGATSWPCLAGAAIFWLDQKILARGYIWLNLRISLSSSAYIISSVRVNPFSTIYRLNVVVKCSLKPWPNGLASRRKLITWVYLRLRLARPCVHLRWLSMSCAHFGRDQICTQVKACFSPLSHPIQVNASWVTFINLLSGNESRGYPALKCFFLRLACSCEETCQCVWSPNASLYASSTCRYFPPLAGPFDQGLKQGRSFNETICMH